MYSNKTKEVMLHQHLSLIKKTHTKNMNITKCKPQYVIINICKSYDTNKTLKNRL